jgi:hypothetical protein
MTFKLMIGNNFILDSPKNVKFKDCEIFSLDIDNSGPFITTEIFNLEGIKIIQIDKNKIIFCDKDLITRFKKRDHILIVEQNGEIILESRVINKDTIIVSGRFGIQEEILTITQNYILFANGKRIMHSKVKSNNKSISITEKGIKPNL